MTQTDDADETAKIRAMRDLARQLKREGLTPAEARIVLKRRAGYLTASAEESPATERRKLS